MSKQNGMMKRIAKLGLILMMGASMNTNAGWFGFGGTNWKEEVLLHDGSKIIVKRSQSYGGRHEIGQGGSIREQEITFTLPNTNKTLIFKSEFSEDIGGRNFDLLALHILNGTPYIVAQPVGCLAENKWGMPNPPYVFFKHDGKEWQRIPLSEFPAEFKTINLVAETKNDEKIITSQPIVSAELVNKLNGELTQPEYHSILREPVKHEGPVGCGEMIHDGNGGWHGTGLFGKTYEACLQYCKREKFNPKNYPCETLFKGKK
jgi:hypothetical protein